MSDLFGPGGNPAEDSLAEPVIPAGSPAAKASLRQPLAERVRPATLDEIYGQTHLLGPEGTITQLLAHGHLPSLILWGGPGCGKTTIARLLAGEVKQNFSQISAVFSGVADLKKTFGEAERRADVTGKGTVLFVDEIHRFNRSQQDSFLPYVERGTITLIGATTENPSFSLNSALLSRCQVLVLNPLEDEALEFLLKRAERLESRRLPLTEKARTSLRALADGDGRYMLNMAEQILALNPKKKFDEQDLGKILSRRPVLYDKDREEHYNLISALHKSLRGSDPDAALYWFARMLEGGEDPLYIARRLVRFASEDIGEADPTSLPLAQAAAQAYERLGSPEGEVALAQAIVHLAVASKSNAVYKAYKAARLLARETGSLIPPAHIRNAPTKLMKDLGYGAGHAYDHDAEDGFSGQDYFPEAMARVQLYYPVERGFEERVKKRLDILAQKRSSRQS